MNPIEAPAKINLFLEVLDRRSDGYHNVCLVSQQIDLRDRIRIDRADTDHDQLTVIGPFAGSVPADPAANSVLRTIIRMRERWPDVPPLAIELEKNIPAGAGLGGGSADAAAVAMEVRSCFLPTASMQSVILLLAELGSDMPFAAIGGTALVEGRGEKVRPLDFAFGSVHYVLASPPIEIPTAWAYQALDAVEGRPRKDFIDLCSHLREGDYGGFARGVWNAFEAVVFPEHPELAELVELLEQAGCDGAWMTGSGSNLVGVCPDAGKAEVALSAFEQLTDCPARIVRPYVPISRQKE